MQLFILLIGNTKTLWGVGGHFVKDYDCTSIVLVLLVVRATSSALQRADAFLQGIEKYTPSRSPPWQFGLRLQPVPKKTTKTIIEDGGRRTTS